MTGPRFQSFTCGGRSSPVAAADVARAASAVLQDPAPHIGRVFELTGPRSEDMDGVAEEYSRALGKPVRYVDVPAADWTVDVLAKAGLPPHVQEHLVTLAALHRQNRFDRMTHTLESLTGQPARTIEDFVTRHCGLFTLPDRVASNQDHTAIDSRSQ